MPHSRVTGVASLCLNACLGFSPSHGEPNNVVYADGYAFFSLSGSGIGILPDEPDGALRTQASVLEGVHDLSVASGRLFALDADEGFALSFDIAEDGTLSPNSGAVSVPVGPFSGIASVGSHVVVSGGTDALTVLSVTDAGALQPTASLDLDRGQPDVSVSADGEVAFVSTHFDEDVDGFEFGLTALRINPSLTVLDRMGFEGAGFSGGTSNPANFPIETAVDASNLLLAHGGGLEILDFEDDAFVLRNHVSLPMDATSVDVRDGEAVVVGIEPEPTLVVVDVAGARILHTVALPKDAKPTGVASTARGAVIAAQSGGILVAVRGDDEWTLE